MADLHQDENSFLKGKKSELVVQNFYEQQGWFCLANNYRGIGFELDLILQKDKMLVFVEVKTLKKFNLIDQLLPQKKILALKKGANVFLTKNPKSLDKIENYRFDLVIVQINGKITVFENIHVE